MIETLKSSGCQAVEHMDDSFDKETMGHNQKVRDTFWLSEIPDDDLDYGANDVFEMSQFIALK
jgi:hypothetical protein